MKDKLKTETLNQPINPAFRFSRMLATVLSSGLRNKVKMKYVTFLKNILVKPVLIEPF